MYITRSETSFLQSKFDKAINEKLGLTVLVSGEAGLGKTAFINDFIQNITKKYKYNKFYKVLSASGYCLDMDGSSRSYNSWKELFIDLETNLIAMSGSDEDDDKSKVDYKKIVKTIYDGQGSEWLKLIPVVGNYASVLLKTVKDVSKEVSAQKAANDIVKIAKEESIKSQEDILIQVMSQFRKLAEKYTLIVFIDDIHWFDLSSRDLFFYLAKNLIDKPYPLLLIGSYRPEELQDIRINAATGIAEKHPLEELISNLQKFNAVEECQLKRFDENQFKEFINVRFPKHEFTNIFLKETEHLIRGNALFLSETINNFLEKGIIYEADGISKNKELINYEEVPKTISEVIKERFERLPDDFQEILQIASVMGEDFSVEIIMSILEENQIKFYRKIEKLKNDFGIIENSKKVYDKLIRIYQFVHKLVQKYVYLEIDEEFRVDYHKLVAETIRKFFAGNSIKKVVEQYSFHFGIGNGIIDFNGSVIIEDEKLKDEESKTIVEEYLEYVKEIAANYEKNYLNTEAIKRFDIVIAISKKLNDLPSVIDYSLKKGKISELIGKWNEAESNYNSALSMSVQLKDKSKTANSKKSIGYLLLRKGEYEKALTFFNESTTLFEEIKDKSGVAKNLVNSGVINSFKGNYTAALENYEKALKIREELNERNGISTVLMNMGNLFYYDGDFSKAEDYYSRALKISEEISDKKNISDITKNLGAVKYAAGEFEQANLFYEKALKICEELSDIKGIAEISNNIGSIHCESGKYENADNAFDKAFKIYEELGDRKGIGKVIQNRAVVLKEKDDYEKSITYFNDALKLYEELDDKLEIALTHYNIGDIQIRTKMYEDSNINLDKAISICKEINVKFRLCLFLYKKAFLLFIRNKINEAVSMNSEASKLAEEIKRIDVIFKCKVLDARISSLTNKENSLNLLKHLLNEFKNDEQAAEINYEIYKLNNSNEAKQATLDLYSKVFEKTPKNEYRKIIEELKKV